MAGNELSDFDRKRQAKCGKRSIRAWHSQCLISLRVHCVLFVAKGKCVLRLLRSDVQSAPIADVALSQFFIHVCMFGHVAHLASPFTKQPGHDGGWVAKCGAHCFIFDLVFHFSIRTFLKPTIKHLGIWYFIRVILRAYQFINLVHSESCYGKWGCESTSGKYWSFRLKERLFGKFKVSGGPLEPSGRPAGTDSVAQNGFPARVSAEKSFGFPWKMGPLQTSRTRLFLLLRAQLNLRTGKKSKETTK